MTLMKNRHVVLTDVLYRCAAWYLIIRKKHRLRVLTSIISILFLSYAFNID